MGRAKVLSLQELLIVYLAITFFPGCIWGHLARLAYINLEVSVDFIYGTFLVALPFMLLSGLLLPFLKIPILSKPTFLMWLFSTLLSVGAISLALVTMWLINNEAEVFHQGSSTGIYSFLTAWLQGCVSGLVIVSWGYIYLIRSTAKA
jgi:hypothetical protein